MHQRAVPDVRVDKGRHRAKLAHPQPQRHVIVSVEGSVVEITGFGIGFVTDINNLLHNSAVNWLILIKCGTKMQGGKPKFTLKISTVEPIPVLGAERNHVALAVRPRLEEVCDAVRVLVHLPEGHPLGLLNLAAAATGEHDHCLIGELARGGLQDLSHREVKHLGTDGVEDQIGDTVEEPVGG